MKCSPTPWRVEYQKRFPAWDDRSDPRVVDANGRSIMAPNVDHPGLVDEVKIANCHRAAAAPDLLASLRVLLPWALEAMKARRHLIDSGDGVGMASGDDDEHGLPAGWPPAMDYRQAIANIAKAEGGTV